MTVKRELTPTPTRLDRLQAVGDEELISAIRKEVGLDHVSLHDFLMMLKPRRILNV